MEKSEANRMEVDPLLAKWALDEGIIESLGDGEYRLCAGIGSGAGENHLNSNGKLPSNGGVKPEDDDDPSITVAIPVAVVDSMNVD